MDPMIKLAVASHRDTKKYRNMEMKWSEFAKRCSSPVRTTETVAEFAKMSKKDQIAIKDCGGYVTGHLRKGSRMKGNVVSRNSGVLDADYIPASMDFPARIRELFSNTEWFLYSTRRHTPESPRFRLVMPFSREISEDEYPAVMRKVAQSIGMDCIDDSSYESNRMMFWPSVSHNGEYVFLENHGDALDPDVYLNSYADWRDCSLWPTSSRESEVIEKAKKEQQDPLTKEGTVGAFNRAYTPMDAIDTFVPDYEPATVAGRYQYTKARSIAGVVVYENKWVYSHHATDPACGKLLSAFDLVRIHKFPDEDEHKSFLKMAEFAVKDERVNLLLTEERRAAASAEFAEEDWEKKLQRMPRSVLLQNSISNLILILNHDPALKDLVFNQLSDSIEIKGDVPWPHPSRFWRDADTAQLVCYIDTHYGTFSSRNYEIAMAKVTDDRSYHPIREYIDALPAWDGTPRVDTLLVDYLGAADNAYVRAVTRKTLCAAVARVQTPGIKFDSMLVLNGPQGVGKSTLISRLGGEWFSDSLSLSDTKDKTAAEKLQGYWILEIGELAGLKKAEVETLRSFLSRQNDIYRASFGRRVTPHLRQCVFFGTTNAERGYLRDTTGNRRFWPVKTPGGGNRQSWQITKDEVAQIWAETLTYVKAGEKLYLNNHLEKLAKEEQREAMEADEREGLVREYLDRLLPDNWDKMDVYDRQNYIRSPEDPTLPKGKNRRKLVSNMEIWCECFGKHKEDIKPSDSYAIAAIMERIDSWEKTGKIHILPIYGRQRTYSRL